MKRIEITVFGCEPDEAPVFCALAARYGVTLTMKEAPVPALGATEGSSCISVSHKYAVSASGLTALRRAGVRYICTRSIGCDHIDMEAAKRLGIAVGTVSYAPDSVADYTIMLMLMAIRDAKQMITRVGRYDFRLSAVRGKELREMTVGVLGAGRIGQAVMKRLQGFGCRVLACSSGRQPGCVPLQEVLAQSDIITLHTPLTKENYHMIGRRQIACMKPSAYLINTGRGALIDTAELIKALEIGTLGGAALDVLEGEAGFFYFDCAQRALENQFLRKLHKMPNVILSPHTAYYTGRVLYETVEQTILNCLDFERRQNHA